MENMLEDITAQELAQQYINYPVDYKFLQKQPILIKLIEPYFMDAYKNRPGFSEWFKKFKNINIQN